MTDAVQTIGKQLSFRELFGEFARVEIPIIQRDYAQGRPRQEELRREFLAALKGALECPAEDPTLPLDLDFVYGSALATSSSEDDVVFSPLDGQQRLTTLFLLHWYLAWNDGKGGDFQERFVVNRRSRFSYEVRPSSHDFFNALGTNFPPEKPTNGGRIDDLIRDKPWFFQAWRNDPTIVSALTMLQEIHQLFKGCEGYYDRLTDSQSPRVTFQLLELKHFALSDDLYIKMNARGKPLTPFETFKARLEQHLDELLPDDKRPLAGGIVSIKEYFSSRMDTAWTDLFWKHRDPKTNLFDTEIMRLVRSLALVCLDPEDEQSSKTVSELRATGPNLSFAKLHELKCLNAKMLQTLVAVLDYWSAEPPDESGDDNSYVYTSARAFKQATTAELTYPELVKFAGFCAFIHSHPQPINAAARDTWLRVVTNLVNNSDIERPTDFLDSLKSLNTLASHTDQILEYLAIGDEVGAFSRQQVREERIKAALISRGREWQELIVAAERHGYFEGQIEFLLRFSGILEHWLIGSKITWTDAEEATARALFARYLKKAEAVFDAKGLRSFKNSIWERALLAIGDYTLSHGKNKSFLQNRASSGDRRPTWKMLLRGHLTDPNSEKKREMVKRVLDMSDLEKGIEKSLQDAIVTIEVTDRWRQMLVNLPQAIAYCAQRMFRIQDNGAVYLISKLRTSSAHVELWSYYLYETTLKKMWTSGDLGPFTRDYIEATNEYYVPCVLLKWRESRVDIDFVGQFRVAFRTNAAASNQFLIEEVGRTLVLATNVAGSYALVSPDDVRKTIDTIVAAGMSLEERLQADSASSRDDSIQ